MIETLIQTHGGRLMSLLRRLAADAEEANDAWQETWCAVWRALPRLRPEVDLWPYIRRVAVAKSIDRWRRPGPPIQVGLPADPPAAADREQTAGSALDLSVLSPEQRLSITLFFYEGCSVREIAAVLGAKEATVKTWLFRGRRHLRRQLAARQRSGDGS